MSRTRELAGERSAMRDTRIALIRGINVGHARRVAMSDLRAVVEELGYADVRTLLNSGNVIFTAPGVLPRKACARIELALAARLGIPARVTVITASELAAVVSRNPILELATDWSRLLVAFLAEPRDRSQLEPLSRMDWEPEALAIGTRVAYIWCPPGVLASPLIKAIGRALGDAVTTRNWATVTKLHTLTLK